MTAPNACPPCALGLHDRCSRDLAPCDCAEAGHGAEGDAPIEHGTLTAYTKRGCRCDLCREVWNAYMRWWRADQRGRLHGGCPTCACQLPEKPTRVTPPSEGRA